MLVLTDLTDINKYHIPAVFLNCTRCTLEHQSAFSIPPPSKSLEEKIRPFYDTWPDVMLVNI